MAAVGLDQSLPGLRAHPGGIVAGKLAASDDHIPTMVKPRTLESQILGSLWGSVVGDALGVPVEFHTRSQLSADPVIGMRAHGTHDQPAGTWSDDTSLVLCTIESLLTSNGLNTKDMAGRFVRWLLEAHWTPHGKTFDVGIAARQAIARFAAGKPAERCGGREEFDNGNGSLMRILPAALWFLRAHQSIALEAIHRISSITHAHPRSQMACGFFALFIRAQRNGKTPAEALHDAWDHARQAYASADEFREEWPAFVRLHPHTLPHLPEADIRSTGYCVHTLEASIWCLLHAASFEQAVLSAVNLGDDTDTTASVAGALAGMHFGHAAIPAAWLQPIARHDEIQSLFHVFATRLRV